MGDKTLSIKLFLLERQENPVIGEYSKCVVAAIDEVAAREIANGDSEAEGYVWTDRDLVTSIELSEDTNDGVEGIQLWSKE
jgi:hypothetical protein